MSTLRIFCMTMLQNYITIKTWSQGFHGYLRHGVPQIIVSSIAILPVIKVPLVKEKPYRLPITAYQCLIHSLLINHLVQVFLRKLYEYNYTTKTDHLLNSIVKF